MRTHQQSVHDQFDPRARAYLDSAVHSQGPDLARAVEYVRATVPPRARALDVGCGAGHLSFALAPCLEHVTALDPAAAMLATVAQVAKERGLTQIETHQGHAEALDFADGSFSLVCTRYSAHHWTRLPVAVREMRRVLRPGGYLLITDVLGADDALVDTHLQALELLRDPSHVRDRTADEWRRLLNGDGFVDIEHDTWPTRLAFDLWAERMHTPAPRVAVIRELQQAAPREVQDALAIESDGSFTVKTGMFRARSTA